MVGTLERELNAENLNSYANACVEIGTYLDYFYSEGYSELLMPSRGAYPFLMGAMASRAFDSSEGFFQDITCLPLTADISSSDSNFDSAKEIRRFWVKVYSSMLNNRDDVFSRFYTAVSEIGGRDCSNLLLTLKKRSKDDKVLLIDTVISGRASATILDAFDEFGIKDYHAFLVVDSNGEKLREPFKSRLEEACKNDKAVLIPVSRLFTEDRSPAISGISSIVYPSLMKIAAESLGCFSDFGLVGAGIWEEFSGEGHCLNRSFAATDYYENPLEAFNDIQALVKYSVGKTKLDRGESCYLSRYDLESNLDLSMQRLIANVNSEKILNKETTMECLKSELSRYSKYNPTINITSSHIITVDFPEEVCRRIIQDFKKKNRDLFKSRY